MMVTIATPVGNALVNDETIARIVGRTPVYPSPSSGAREPARSKRRNHQRPWRPAWCCNTLWRSFTRPMAIRSGSGVGIGPTKTLAKLANHIAKKNPDLGGVCDLTEERERARWMADVPLDAIWGVGPASQAKLKALGCTTVADVRDLDPRLVRRGMTVVGARIVHELRGNACLDLASLAPTRKGCAVTRSFSRRVDDLATMEQAVAAHAGRLGEKLRRDGLGTDHVSVFYHTSEHDRDRPQRSASTTVTLPEATNDTLVLAKAATKAARGMWRDGYRYSKAGLVTTDLVAICDSQRALPGLGRFDREKGAALMTALDACNRRFGRGTVVPGNAGFAPRRTWSTKFEMRSPRYTTRMDELQVVSAA